MSPVDVSVLVRKLALMVLAALNAAQSIFPPYIRALRNRFCPPAP